MIILQIGIAYEWVVIRIVRRLELPFNLIRLYQLSHRIDILQLLD